jgi:cysteine-rich repeat protein
MRKASGMLLATLVVGCDAHDTNECFLAGTLILTPDGAKRIELLEIGQVVWSYDPDKGLVARAITALHRQLSRVICRVASAGACLKGVTPSHPMYDAARDRYTALRDLDAESRLLLFLDGARHVAPIDEIQIEEAFEPSFDVYNLTVEGPEHNYIADGVLVHNKTLIWPRVGVCGDGVVDFPYEQCDDGDRINGDGCSTACAVDGGGPTFGTSHPPPEHCVPSVELADPVLEREVRAAVARPDGELPYAEVSQLQVLAVEDEPVADLGGVECLSELRSIALAGGSIADLEPLSNLPLRTLIITDHRISDLTPLSGLLGLQMLDIAANQVSDLSMLSSLTRLDFLNVGDNRVSDIAALASLPLLTQLHLPGNTIDVPAQLSALGALFNLDISRNAISDLSFLVEMEGIRYLSADGNGISSLAFLSNWDPQGWSHLLSLSLRDNAITDLTPLVSASWLGVTAVLLDGNPIDCITQSDNLAALRDRGLWLGLVCSGKP